jgi:hypothetical protein
MCEGDGRGSAAQFGEVRDSGVMGMLISIVSPKFVVSPEFEVNLYAAVAKVVDSIPKGVQSVFHGCCGEVNAVSKALNAGADVAGSTIRTISIQTGKVIEACSSCQAILTRFGIKF